MKNPVDKFLLAMLVVGLVACGKNESVNAAAPPPPTAAGKTEAAAVTAAPSPASAETPATSVREEDAPKPSDSEAPPSERIAEVEETEPSQEPIVKGNASPPLKLAQLQPRVTGNSRFKEGTHYQRLSPTQSVDVSPDQVQIVEFFWYGCPHCYALDPQLEAWRTSTQPNGKPPYVVFSRIPATWDDTTRFHGRFYFAAESLGKLDELHALIFREIHVNGNPLNTLDKAREFFAAHGADAQEFQKHFGAMSLERKLDNANLLAQRYRINSVPTLVVNGKYVTDLSMAGGPDPLLLLLNELAAREHGKE